SAVRGQVPPEGIHEAVGVAAVVLGHLLPQVGVGAVLLVLLIGIDRLELRGERHDDVVGGVVNRRVGRRALGGLSRRGGHRAPLPSPTSLAGRPSNAPASLGGGGAIGWQRRFRIRRRSWRSRRSGEASAYNPGPWRSTWITLRRRRSGPSRSRRCCPS